MIPIPIKERAEFQIRAYTDNYIPKVTSHHFSIADVFQDLLHRDQGEGTRFSLDESAPPMQWGRQPEFNRIDPTCCFVYLGERVFFGSEAIRAAHNAKAGSSAVCGFTLVARTQYLNSVMLPNLGASPKGPQTYEKFRWKALKGSRWETFKPLRFPGITFITHAAQTPDEEVEAQSLDPMPANGQMYVPLMWRGVSDGQTQPAAFRFLFANNSLSVVFRYGNPPTVEYFENGAWHVRKTLEGAIASTFEHGTMTKLYLMQIAGRLVVGIDNMFFECLASDKAVGTGAGARAVYGLRDTSWGAGVVRVRSFGVSVMVGIARLNFLDKLGRDGQGKPEQQTKSAPKGFKPRRGEIERDVPRPGLTQRMDDEASYGDGYAAGWDGNGTKATVRTQVLPDKVRYKLGLEASVDGVSAPFVNKVVARYLGLFTVGNAPFLDFAKACVSGRETTAFPPLSPGADWTIEVDRSALDHLNPNWGNYVKQFNPVEIMVRWKYSDGSRSEWVGRLRGYINMASMSVNQANKWMMSLQLRDQIMRLQKPHAVIDSNYFPFDLLFSANGGKPIYGWECIKEILSIALGEDAGASLQTYLPPFHPSILDSSSGFGMMSQFIGTSPPMGNGFRLPAPFGSSPLEWIKKFMDADYAQFFYGYPNGALYGTSQITGATVPVGGTSALATPWPVPIYGQYPLIMAGRPTWIIPDAAYDEEDTNLLAFTASVTGLPEQAINRVLCWGNPPQGGGADMPFPALKMGEALLPDSDMNAAIFSWARTLVKQGPQYFYGNGVAQLQAERLMSLFRDKKIRRVQVECRGEERMQWGDKVMPKMQNTGANGNYSDPHLKIHGEEFRIWRLSNDYKFHESGADQFKTTATCLPISALGY